MSYKQGGKMTRDERNEMNYLRKKEKVCSLDKWELFRLSQLEAIANGYVPSKEEK